MQEVIAFYFNCVARVFTLIKDNWILSIFFLIGIFGFIVNLINATEDRK